MIFCRNLLKYHKYIMTFCGQCNLHEFALKNERDAHFSNKINSKNFKNIFWLPRL